MSYKDVRREENFFGVTVDELVSWESNELSHEQELDLFQRLVNSGLAWQLQGTYGRYARYLIDTGQIQERK